MAVNFDLKKKLFSTYCTTLYEWLELPAYQQNGPKGKLLEEELAVIRKDGKCCVLSPFKYITCYEVMLVKRAYKNSDVGDLPALRNKIGNPLSFHAFCALHYLLEAQW